MVKSNSISSDYENVILSLYKHECVVEEERNISLPSKNSKHKILGIPTDIDVTKLKFITTNNPATFVSNQVYKEPKTTNSIHIMKKFISKNISIVLCDEIINGVLIDVNDKKVVVKSFDNDNNHTVFWKDSKLKFIKFDESVSCDSYYSELLSQGSLNITINTDSKGEQSFLLLYTNHNIIWKTEYEIRANINTNKLQITGYHKIVNNSNKTYKNAKLRFILPERIIENTIIGSVVSDAGFGSLSKKLLSGSSSVEGGVHYFQKHIFDIEERYDIEANSIIKIPFTSTELPYNNVYYLDGNLTFYKNKTLQLEETLGKKKLSAQLYDSISFKNISKTNLPPGKMKIYFVKDFTNNQNDKEEKIESYLLPISNINTVQFDGCYLDQTAIIPIKPAKAVTCIKERKSFKLEEKLKKLTESYSIQITSEMKPKKILVRESFYKAKQWELSKTIPEKYQIVGSQNVIWCFDNPTIGDIVELKYTVTYSWISEQDNTMQLIDDASVFDDEEKEEIQTKSPTHSTSFSFFSKILSKKQ